jgi:hypothetical protein
MQSFDSLNDLSKTMLQMAKDKFCDIYGKKLAKNSLVYDFMIELDHSSNTLIWECDVKAHNVGIVKLPTTIRDIPTKIIIDRCTPQVLPLPIAAQLQVQQQPHVIGAALGFVRPDGTHCLTPAHFSGQLC